MIMHHDGNWDRTWVPAEPVFQNKRTLGTLLFYSEPKSNRNLNYFQMGEYRFQIFDLLKFYKIYNINIRLFDSKLLFENTM